MNPVWSTIISFISIGAITAILINTIKYILLPHYRLEINRKKHKDDADAVLKYYTEVYKKNRRYNKSKFELQKATNAAFGTKQFNYELLFMLFDRNERDVENRAKSLLNRWILIRVDYVHKKIKCKLSINQIKWLTRMFITLYLINSIIILLTSAEVFTNYQLISKEIESYMILGLFSLIFIFAYFLYVLGCLKSLEPLIDR